MIINILHLVEGARKASGLTVIIDVFRAFSTACYAFDQGAVKLHPVADVKEAFRMKQDDPDVILMGEINEKIIPGFDFGNSPSHILDVDFTGKTIVQRTSAGTQGLVNATNADEILTGSFVNVSAIVDYIRHQGPEVLSLVCMGYSARHRIEEDTLLAEYIKNELTGETNDFESIVSTIRHSSGQRFFDPANAGHSPPGDFDLCLKLDAFDFVLKVSRIEDLITLHKVAQRIP